MQAIIAAGGAGIRLAPSTTSVSKHLLPVYDKPLIYYPLAVLMLAGIRDVLVVSQPVQLRLLESLLGNGSHLGIRLNFAEQDRARGIADTILVAREFIGLEPVCLVLGDNIFHGSGFRDLLQDTRQAYDSEVDGRTGATLFAYPVGNPSAFGVLRVDHHFQVTAIEEKPADPKSNWVATGLYFYDNSVVDVVQSLTPSYRGELEITDVNRYYLENHQLRAIPLGRGFAWLDAGTPVDLLEAGNYVHLIEKRQGFKIGCVEEIAYRMGYISLNELTTLGQSMEASEYGQYLLRLAREEA